ncbi:MAG: extracellular solute-binding protein [Eubacteriales bacterium]|nr:extracellular solute-binding protein [Eubacteriales bacterium]
MKRFRKTISLALALMTALLAISCVAEGEDVKIANGDVTLTIYINMRPGAAQAYTTYAEHPVVQKMMEETGLNLEFIHPTGDEATFFNVTVASNEWPDLWCTGFFASYPGGVEGAMEDGVLLNINELTEQCAPDFLNLVNEYGVMRDFISDSGVIVNMGQVMNCDYVYDKAFLGFIVRKDVLDELGMELPVTYDDWDAMLSAMQEAGFSTPLAIPFADGNFTMYSNLAAGYGVRHGDFFLQDGRVVYSPVQDGYREYLGMLKDWYEKGYFNADSFAYNLSNAKEAMQEGKVAVAYSHAAHTTTVQSIGVAIDEDFAVAGLVQPRKNADDVLNLVYRNVRTSNGAAWYVSADTKYPEECVKFLNYLYKPETQRLAAWGVGTEACPTFEETENGRVFTEWMKANPEGLDFQIMKDRYILAPFQTIYDEETEQAQYNYPEKLQAIESFCWNANADAMYPEKSTMTVEESSEYAQIMNQIKTYSDEMMQKFITGLASLDDDWDTYVQQIEALNINRACQIKQDAMERYYAR